MTIPTMILAGSGFTAFLILVLCARKGLAEGLFRSISRVLAVILAILISLRLWHIGAAALPPNFPIPADLLAGLLFWGIFGVVFIALSGLAGLVSEDRLPVYPRLLERFGGVLFGCLTGLLLCVAISIGLLPVLPRSSSHTDSSRLGVFLQTGPLAIYSTVENLLTGLPADSPSRTILPSLEPAGGTTQVIWK